MARFKAADKESSPVEASYDLLIGADGANSRVRGLLQQEVRHPHSSTSAARGLPAGVLGMLGVWRLDKSCIFEARAVNELCYMLAMLLSCEFHLGVAEHVRACLLSYCKAYSVRCSAPWTCWFAKHKLHRWSPGIHVARAVLVSRR